MKVRTILTAFCLILLINIAPVSAHPVNRMRVKVPFTFNVGASMLPAGDYIVERLNMEGLLLIRSEDGQDQVLVFTNSLRGHSMPEAEARLDFHRYEDQYFLSQVWMSADQLGFKLPTSRQEREMIKSHSKEMAAKRADQKTVSVPVQ